MKKISLALLSLAPILTAATLQSIHDGELQTVITNQTAVNEVVNSTAKVDTTVSTKKMSTAVQLMYSDNINIVNIPLSYKVLDSVGVSLSVPIVSNSVSENTGIGDISVGASYNFGNTDNGAGLNITTLRYKTTTGGDALDGTGSGATAISISHAIAKDISDTFQLHGLLSYTLNDDNDLGLTYGDSYTAMVGESHTSLFSNNFKTSTKLVYFSSGESTFGPWANNDELTTADFWIELSSKKLINNVPLAFGLKVPVSYVSAANPNDSGAITFYLSASSNFF